MDHPFLDTDSAHTFIELGIICMPAPIRANAARLLAHIGADLAQRWPRPVIPPMPAPTMAMDNFLLITNISSVPRNNT